MVGAALSFTGLKAAGKLQSQRFLWGIHCCAEKQAKVLLVGRNTPECICWLVSKWVLARAQGHWLISTAQEPPRRHLESNFRGRSWSKLSALLSLAYYGGALCLRLRTSELGVEARGRAPSDVCQCHGVSYFGSLGSSTSLVAQW